MWKWGVRFILLVGVQVAQAASSDDPFLCSNYLAWFGAETQLQMLRSALDKPNVPAFRRANLESRIQKLAAKATYYRVALLAEDTLSPGASRLKPLARPAGGELEPTPPVTLETVFNTRPQTKDVLEGGVRRLILSGNGQALITIPGESRRAHIWDLKIRKYYTIESSQNILDADIDLNGNAVVLDAAGTMTIHALPTGTRVPSKAQLVKTRAMALSDFHIFSLADTLKQSRAGVYGDFKPLAHGFNGKERMLRVTTDTKFAAVVTDTDQVRVFHLDSKKEIPMPAATFDGRILDLKFSPDAHQWVALTENAQLVKWSARAPARYETFSLKGLEATSLAVGAGNQVLVAGNAFGGLEGMLVAVDVNLGEETARYRTEHVGGISAVTLSINGELILTAGTRQGELSIFRNPDSLAH